MKLSEILSGARKKISERGAWTQGWSALCERNMPVDPASPRAVSFCALGAIEAVSANYIERAKARGHLMLYTGSGVAGWNDTHTHAEVLALFDEAIASARVLEDASARSTKREVVIG